MWSTQCHLFSSFVWLHFSKGNTAVRILMLLEMGLWNGANYGVCTEIRTLISVQFYSGKHVSVGSPTDRSSPLYTVSCAVHRCLCAFTVRLWKFPKLSTHTFGISALRTSLFPHSSSHHARECEFHKARCCIISRKNKAEHFRLLLESNYIAN